MPIDQTTLPDPQPTEVHIDCRHGVPNASWTIDGKTPSSVPLQIGDVLHFKFHAPSDVTKAELTSFKYKTTDPASPFDINDVDLVKTPQLVVMGDEGTFWTFQIHIHTKSTDGSVDGENYVANMPELEVGPRDPATR
jgi:hypothetical protein